MMSMSQSENTTVKKVLAFSLNFENCLFNQAYIEKTKGKTQFDEQLFLEANAKLIKLIAEMAKGYNEVLLLINSEVQNKAIDRKKIKFQIQKQKFFIGSCFEAIGVFGKKLDEVILAEKTGSPIAVKLKKLLMYDLHKQIPPGTSFQKAMNALSNPTDDDLDENEKEDSEYKNDRSKVSHFYAQTHYVASEYKNKNCVITWVVLDNVKAVLAKINEIYFNKNNEVLLPESVKRIILWKYRGENKAPVVEKFSEWPIKDKPSKDKPPTIAGGAIDTHYPENFRLLRKIFPVIKGEMEIAEVRPALIEKFKSQRIMPKPEDFSGQIEVKFSPLEGGPSIRSRTEEETLDSIVKDIATKSSKILIQSEQSLFSANKLFCGIGALVFIGTAIVLAFYFPPALIFLPLILKGSLAISLLPGIGFALSLFIGAVILLKGVLNRSWPFSLMGAVSSVLLGIMAQPLWMLGGSIVGALSFFTNKNLDRFTLVFDQTKLVEENSEPSPELMPTGGSNTQMFKSLGVTDSTSRPQEPAQTNDFTTEANDFISVAPELRLQDEESSNNLRLY